MSNLVCTSFNGKVFPSYITKCPLKLRLVNFFPFLSFINLGCESDRNPLHSQRNSFHWRDSSSLSSLCPTRQSTAA